MSTGRTFDIGDSSARDPSNARNSVQVTLIQEQIPNLASVEDNISETDPDCDWAEKIEFNHLCEYTLQE